MDTIFFILARLYRPEFRVQDGQADAIRWCFDMKSITRLTMTARVEGIHMNDGRVWI